MSREQIKNTTGIAGAMVLRAVHELAKIGVLEYDEDTAMVTLKKRLFAKKSLEEKKSEN
jgi:DNA-binding IclR family transcriptional regulator